MVPFSGKPFKDGKPGPDDIHAWFNKSLRQAYPNGLHGRIWVVDYTQELKATDSSITQLSQTFSQCPRLAPYSIQYIRLYPAYKRGQPWAIINGSTGAQVVGHVLVRNPDDHARGSIDFQMALANEIGYPRRTPHFGLSSWKSADIDDLWTALFDKWTEQGRNAQEAQKNIVSCRIMDSQRFHD